MRSLVPSRPLPLPLPFPPPLHQPAGCVNVLLRDPSMKRHMEHICGRPPPPLNPSHPLLPDPSSSGPLSCSSPSSYPPSNAQGLLPVYQRLAESGTSSSTELPREPSASAAFSSSSSSDSENHGGCSSHSSPELEDEHDRPCNDSSRVASEDQGASAGGLLSDCNPRFQWKDEVCTADTRMLAAVDMGSNSFHIVVAKADSQGHFQVVDSEKEYIRLGSSAGLSLITPEAEARALEALKRFKALAAAYGAPLRVVATAAVREAGNRGAFLGNIIEKAGIEVELLSGTEEANLIYLGILQALPVYEKLVLTVDIGGGSTEFVLGREGSPILATSVKLGHMQLTERFLGSGNVPFQKSQLEALRQHIRLTLNESGIVDQVCHAGYELAIGSSGTIESIEQIVNQGHACDCISTLMTEELQFGLYGFRDREFTQDELSVVVRKLCQAKNNEQRAKSFGLPGKRADVLVGGAILLEEIFVALGVNKMRVSPYALREGLIADTLKKSCATYRPLENVRRSSVVSLAKRFYSPQRLVSASHSACLAKDILAGLKTSALGSVSEVISLLDENDRELLEAAATLHAVGMFVGFKDYHKHSQYLIKNSDILVGFSPIEVQIISLLAKYHRKKVPSKKDEDFAQLPIEVQNKIRALCAIVRIAVALNRCHCSAVERVLVVQDVDRCVFVAVPSLHPSTHKVQDVSVELWAALDTLEYFDKVFKMKSSIVTADQNDERSLKAGAFRRTT